MTRRPRRHRPPRLDAPRARSRSDGVRDPGAARPSGLGASARSAPPTRGLVAARITGPHARLGRDAVRAALRALVAGDPGARLGCGGLERCSIDEVRDALVASHGWDPEPARAAIDPRATLAAARRAAARLADAAERGARVALATSRPASLLGLAQGVAAHLGAGGATVLVAERAAIDGSPGRDVRWIGGVAVVSDGQALLGVDGAAAGTDWLFAMGRPDLVVADRGFAGTALRAGLEVIAWADLDAPALSLAAARGQPVLVVPLDEQRVPAAYEPLVRLLTEPPEHGPSG